MKEPDFFARKDSIGVWERYAKFAFAGALAILAIAGFAWYRSRKSQDPQQTTAALHFAKVTEWSSGDGLALAPAISHDGKTVAYASDREGQGSLAIWTQPVDSGKPSRVTSGEFNESDPDFSADGRHIVFRSERDGGGIYVAPAAGGAPRLIVKEGWKPRFSPDGKWIAYCNLSGSEDSDSVLGVGQIFVVPAEGGEPKRIRPEFPAARNPIWSPDSKRLLFSGTRGDGVRDWWVSGIEGGEAIRTFAMERLHGSVKRAGVPEQWRGEKIYFSAAEEINQHIWEVSISSNGEISGPARRLTDGDGVEQQTAIGPDGRIVFATTKVSIDLWRLPIEPNDAKVLGKAEPLTDTGGKAQLPSLAMAAPKLIYISDKSGIADAWIRDLDRRTEAAATAFRMVGYRPVISPDGLQAAFPSRVDGKCGVVLQSLARNTVPSTLPGCFGIWDWSPDGATLLTFEPTGAMKSVDSVAIPSGERKTALAHPKLGIHGARFSPDGRFIAFASGLASGDAKIYVAPLRSPAARETEWIAITAGGEGNPAWSPDGNTLYFRSKRDGYQCFWAQKLGPGKQPAGEPIAVHHLHQAALGLHLMKSTEFNLTVGKDQLIFNLVKAKGGLRSMWLDGK